MTDDDVCGSKSSTLLAQEEANSKKKILTALSRFHVNLS